MFAMVRSDATILLDRCFFDDVIEEDNCRSREMAIMKNKIVIKCEDSLNNI